MSLINIDYGSQPGQPNPPYGQGDRKPPSTGYQLDVFDLVKRKFGLILFFVIAGVALSAVYFFKAPKTYRSVAKIFVDEKNASVVGDGESFANETAIEQYLITLKSTKILAPAIKAGKFSEYEIFAETEDILTSLRDGNALTAKPADTKTKSGVIKLAFTGADPEECQKVVEYIVQSFDSHIKATTRNVGGESARLVEKVQKEMLSRLNEVEEEIQTLMASPEILNVEGQVVNPHQLQLSMLLQDLHDLRRDRTKLQARIQNVVAARANGNQDELIAEILRESAQATPVGGAYVATHDQFVELKVQEQELLNQFGADHPDVIALQKKIKVVADMRMEELDSVRAGMQGNGRGVDIIDEYVSKLTRDVATLTTEEQQLAQTVKSQQADSTKVAAIVENLNALKRERERLEKGYYTIVEQLSQINVLKEHLWRTLSVLDDPTYGEQVAPSLPICGAAGLFLGTLFGLMLAVFKDMAEKTFRSSDDVASMLNTRVVGHVAFFQKPRPNKLSQQFPNAKPELITIHAPASPASEAYRAIRTSVFFRAQETGAKVIQLTSPVPGDGKSTTISNLAASIAQSGRRVLLIDADLRRPVQAKMFGLKNDVGLTSVIMGEMDPMQAIQVIQPEYLSVLTSGPIPTNPAELLTASTFEQTIQAYRDQFDFILIDTPPMLAVTDPAIVCNHVDMIYFVMRIRNGVRSTSTKAKEMLDSMGVELGGVIVNGIRRKDQKTYEYGGRYGYGAYNYKSAASPQVKRPASARTQKRTRV